VDGGTSCAARTADPAAKIKVNVATIVGQVTREIPPYSLKLIRMFLPAE
jgi:hypothetical protein